MAAKRVHLNQNREVLFTFSSTGRTCRLATTEVVEESELAELNETWIEAIEDIEPPAEEKPAKKKGKRAKKSDGTFVSDDPSTPDVNEAWEGGKAPEEATPKKTTKKGKGK